uniref:NADH-ubiquinone oxidoreductase chain 4 n=1 Tax=Phyllochaetopterus sp. AW-2015 TaxID=1750699 RepID=A0A0S2N0G7_9ANNE|nr:NADH dehydrogenase subunit 4 [Phyllochaetopterus sp. AW-2015]
MLKIILPLAFITIPNMLLPAPMWAMVTQTSLLILFLTTPLILFNPLLDSNHVTSLIEINSLSAPLLALTMFFLPLMLIASQKINHTSTMPLLFLNMTILLTLVLLCAFATSNMISFYIMFELSLVPTAFLIMLWGYQPERVNATFYLLLYTITFSLPLLMMIMYMYNLTHSMSFSLLAYILLPCQIYFPTISALAFTLAFLVKLPLFLLHLWLPKAHVEAPVAGSMILAGILLKLGIYGLLKILPLTPIFTLALPLLLITLSLLGATITSLVCLQQTDMKSLIAYASISHMNLTLAAICTNTSWSWNGALFMSIAHGLASSALFALANYTYNVAQSRNLALFKGLLTIAPNITTWWFIFLIFNFAAPPSLNFASELIIIISIISFSHLIIPLLLATIVFSAAYSMALYGSSQHGQLSSFLQPGTPIIPNSFTLLTFHFIPLIALTLAPQLLLWA